MANFDKPVDKFPHTTDTGKKRGTIANLKHLFKEYGITVRYDEMLKEQSMTLGNVFDGGHADLIANSNLAHLRSLLVLNGMGLNSLDLLPALFAENSINPILDFIESKPWDGVDRILDLADTLTVADNDYDYAYQALKTWLIQCVAAADGAKRTPHKNALPKYELVFVLQGGQGAQKTSWFGRLLPKNLKEYFIDGVHLNPSNRDSVMQSNICWICELGELDSTFKKNEVSMLKAYLSKQTDIMRLPYDKAASKLGRRTSYCGSVNPAIFLVDSTGNRRFLPVQVLACNHIHDIDMQQLWAQVMSLYLGGATWWCDAVLEEYLIERHERHSEINPIHEMIGERFDIERIEKTVNHVHYTATRILQECGIKEPKKNQLSECTVYLKRYGFHVVKSSGITGFWLVKRPGF